MADMTDPSVIGSQLAKIGYKRYAEYLASDHWKDAKARYAASSLPQRCACGAKPNALHHKTYERLGAEWLTDLEPVCNGCHRRIHRKRGRGKAHRPRQPRKRKKPAPLPQVFCGICEGPHHPDDCTRHSAGRYF